MVSPVPDWLMNKMIRFAIIVIVCTMIFPSCGKVIRVLFSYLNDLVQSPEFVKFIDTNAKIISDTCMTLFHAAISFLDTLFSSKINA